MTLNMMCEKDALEGQKLLQVSSKLHCLFRSTAAKDFESYYSDLNEQRMLLKVLQTEKLNAATMNVLKRFPFFFKPSKSEAEELARQSLIMDLGATLEEQNPAPVSDTDTVAAAEERVDPTTPMEQENETPKADDTASDETKTSSSTVVSVTDVDPLQMSQDEECTCSNNRAHTSRNNLGKYGAVSSVFNLDNMGEIQMNEQTVAEEDEAFAEEMAAPAGPHKSAKPAPAPRRNQQNLLVWHRYTEIPFDISSSEFTVKTPVLPLVQGGHLVFLTSRSGQRTTNYSVKIIKKLNPIPTGTVSVQTGAANAQKPQVDTAQINFIHKDEFLVLKKLSHPCVANLLYFCENEFQYYYFFPSYFLPALTGSPSFFSRQGPEVCVYVICCMINTVEYLFRNFIVHRDISAKNVLFSSEGRPVLFDFDYAAFFGSANSPEAKPNYLPDLGTRAPEVTSASIPYEPDCYANCDVWGIGVLLGELLLGTKAITRALKRKLDPHWVFSVKQAQYAVRDSVYSDFGSPHVPRDLMELLRVCLRKSAQDRPTVHNLMQNQLFGHYGVPSMCQVIRQKIPIGRILGESQNIF